MRLLVVEDETVLADRIAEGLRDAGFAVDTAYDGVAAWEKLTVNGYDLTVLDRDLPGLHGDEICRRLRAHIPASRILMLTAAGELNDRVTGLSVGADDYLAKPFAFVELIARIRALIRRPATPAKDLLTAGDLALDRQHRSVVRTSGPVPLTTKEFAVLEILLEAQGRVVSSEELLERAWDEFADPFTNAVRITIARLRRRLGEPPLIDTVIGAGYRILP